MSLSPALAYSYVLHMLGLTGPYVLAIALIGGGIYLILFIRFKPINIIGVICLGFGCVVGAYAAGDRNGGAACEERWKAASYEARIEALKVDHQIRIDKLNLELRAQKEASAYVEEQRKALEQQDADRQQLFDEYRSRIDKLANACRQSTSDDAGIVCAITGNTAHGCSGAAKGSNTKRVR